MLLLLLLLLLFLVLVEVVDGAGATGGFGVRVSIVIVDNSLLLLMKTLLVQWSLTTAITTATMCLFTFAAAITTAITTATMCLQWSLTTTINNNN